MNCSFDATHIGLRSELRNLTIISAFEEIIVTAGNLFTAATPDIQTGSSATLQKVESIQGLLGQLDALVDESQESWRGAASNQFQVLMGEYHADSRQLNNALQAIGHALGTSGTNISSTEQTNLKNMSNIQLPNAKLS